MAEADELSEEKSYNSTLLDIEIDLESSDSLYVRLLHWRFCVVLNGYLVGGCVDLCWIWDSRPHLRRGDRISAEISIGSFGTFCSEYLPCRRTTSVDTDDHLQLSILS